MREITLGASCHIARFSAGETWNASSSEKLEDSPVPNSARPRLSKSSAPTRSATRAGWLIGGGSSVTPDPRRMRLGRWLAAAKKLSDPQECEYSSRKECSTSHK